MPKNGCWKMEANKWKPTNGSQQNGCQQMDAKKKRRKQKSPERPETHLGSCAMKFPIQICNFKRKRSYPARVMAFLQNSFFLYKIISK